ncbi:MAG: hypothetical protein ACK53K_03860 [Burkholderiales bacterium]|jgi:hypothetical protein
MASIFFYLGLGIVIGWFFQKRKIALDQTEEGQALIQFRLDANEQFRNLHVSSNMESLVFDGAEAEIVSEEEHFEATPNGKAFISYSITRYAMNRAGEYFMFKSNIGSKPFLKHLSRDRAKLVLKDKYREHLQAAGSGSSRVGDLGDQAGFPA